VFAIVSGQPTTDDEFEIAELRDELAEVRAQQIKSENEVQLLRAQLGASLDKIAMLDNKGKCENRDNARRFCLLEIITMD